MAPKGKANAAPKAAVKAAAAPKAAGKAKAKAKMRARPRALVPRVRDNRVPVFLELLKTYGYFQASTVRNGRTAETVAAFLFQNCDQAETVQWAGELWYKCPNALSIAIKNKWDSFMAAACRSTWRGVGATTASWAVSRRGAVMGNI